MDDASVNKMITTLNLSAPPRFEGARQAQWEEARSVFPIYLALAKHLQFDIPFAQNKRILPEKPLSILRAVRHNGLAVEWAAGRPERRGPGMGNSGNSGNSTPAPGLVDREAELAALGAAAELQLPLTHRRDIRRLQFVTGHAERGGAPEHHWASLADRQATTVFYMGARTFADMLPRLIAGGLDPSTPAIAVSAATTPRARREGCPVKELPAVLADFDRSVPTLILIGQTLTLGATMGAR